MKKTDFSEKIYLGITGKNNSDWQSKLKEISRLGIEEAAVFLECRKNRKGIIFTACS